MEEKIVEPGDHVSLKLLLKYKDENDEDIEIVNLYLAHESPVHAFIPDERLIPAVNDALLGMRIGETRKIDASVERAYGTYVKEKVKKVPLESVSRDGVLPQLEQIIIQKNIDNTETFFRVIEIDIKEKLATLDGNHYLCNKEITGDITVINIEKK